MLIIFVFVNSMLIKQLILIKIVNKAINVTQNSNKTINFTQNSNKTINFTQNMIKQTLKTVYKKLGC